MNVLDSLRDPIPEPALTRSHERTNEQSEAIPMSCDNCGSDLSDIHNLQNHVKAWCPIKRNTEGSNPERRVAGRLRMEDVDDIKLVSEDDGIDEESNDKGSEEVSDDESSGDTEVGNPEVERWKRHFALIAAVK